MNGLFARAVVAFLACPGMVAFVIPWLILRPVPPVRSLQVLGLGPLALGIALLLWCVRDFYVAGKGTLAPWAPPRRLVVTGLYRVSRNPMYVAVVLILWGWALTLRSRAMAAYAVLMMVIFHLRVVLGEESWLARTHGSVWAAYESRVPRWIGFSRHADEPGDGDQPWR